MNGGSELGRAVGKPGGKVDGSGGKLLGSVKAEGNGSGSPGIGVVGGAVVPGVRGRDVAPP